MFQRAGKFGQKYSGRAPNRFAGPARRPDKSSGNGFDTAHSARQHDQIVADAPQAAHQRVRVGRIG